MSPAPVCWEDPPENIRALRELLLRRPAIRRLFGSSFRFHYPDADPKDYPLPFAVLFEEEAKFARVAPGESAQEPTLVAAFHFDESKHSVGKVEKALAELCQQMVEHEDDGDDGEGALVIAMARRLRSSDPKQSSKAGATDGEFIAYRTCACLFTVSDGMGGGG